VPAGSSDSGAPPTESKPACTIASGYRGQVLGVNVFARLGLDGARLHGRYFYERVGVDIALEGSVAPDGTMHFIEGDPKASSGRFRGACDATGAISGAWIGRSKNGRFRFEPIPPGDNAVVATHRSSIDRPVKEVGPFGMNRCTYEEEWSEVFGLRHAEVERALNGQGLEVRRALWLNPLEASLARECQTGREAHFDWGVTFSFRELATIGGGGYRVVEGAAHPDNNIDVTIRTYDLRTGKSVDDKDVFARPPWAIVLACVKKAKEDDKDLWENFWDPYFAGHDFVLTERGVHFFGLGYPHFAGAFTGSGPTIGYDVLLRDGYLRADSPVERAWSGVAAAPKSKKFCPSGKDAWNYR
jgi:hypothetical protein